MTKLNYLHIYLIIHDKLHNINATLLVILITFTYIKVLIHIKVLFLKNKFCKFYTRSVIL